MTKKKVKAKLVKKPKTTLGRDPFARASARGASARGTGSSARGFRYGSCIEKRVLQALDLAKTVLQLARTVLGRA